MKPKKIIVILGLEHPELQAIYEKADQRAEKWTKRIVFIYVGVLGHSSIFPKVIQCYFTYFTTDAGNAAFELPLPMW